MDTSFDSTQQFPVQVTGDSADPPIWSRRIHPGPGKLLGAPEYQQQQTVAADLVLAAPEGCARGGKFSLPETMLRLESHL
jgi:hypothetical protein